MEEKFTIKEKIQGFLFGIYTRTETVYNPLTRGGLPKVKETKCINYKTGEVLSTSYPPGSLEFNL